jgi:hypothetical protein
MIRDAEYFFAKRKKKILRRIVSHCHSFHIVEKEISPPPDNEITSNSVEFLWCGQSIQLIILPRLTSFALQLMSVEVRSL